MTPEPDTVTKLSLGVIPEIGAPTPMLLQTEHRTVLIFDAITDNPNGPEGPAGTAILEFERCIATKFGYPNDEALPGHPLYDQGLDLYGIYEVLNPTWLEELQQQNRVSFPETEGWSERHFIVALHDSTFECLAADCKITTVAEPAGTAIAIVTKEIIAREYPPYHRSLWSRPLFARAESGEAR